MPRGTHEQVIAHEDLQLALLTEVSTLLGVPMDALDGWTINRIREDSAIDAYVPLGQIDVAGVPTDPSNIDYLVGLFNERAQEVGGSGQRDPVVIGHVPGDAFYMLDGFHRHATQQQRGEEFLHSTIEPNLTYEQVVKRRLEYARTHPEIEFARQVEWMQNVWERTQWSEDVPNVLTAFRAFQDDYAYGKTDDVALIDSLSEKTYQEICDWVRVMSKEWGYTPAEIRENLSKVESFDRGLMYLVFQRAGIAPAGRIGLGHVEVITASYPGEFDLQRAIVDIIIGHELTVTQTTQLIKMLDTKNIVFAEDIHNAAKDLDFIGLKKFKSSKPKQIISNTRSREVRPETYGVQPDRSAVALLRGMRQNLPLILVALNNGELDEEAVDHTLEIAAVLTETLAQLALRSQVRISTTDE